ncbi:hydroxymethylglutaryl-CoA reductase, degradative [uncultured Mesonia sp.]|uniref:hydroxymethylglutaryl-CoA reductase, degradative n=1 Tax=uncultured Mesonia sp. TaxID=399731 RepID=UPI00374E8234
MMKQIQGFSKLSKQDKIEWLATHFFQNADLAKQTLMQYWNSNQQLQQLHDEFTENTISNLYIPFGVAPNFLIDGQFYSLPMAIEESSVVAAASNAAKFWQSRGGFKTEIIGTEKVGQIHFTFNGQADFLFSQFNSLKQSLIETANEVSANMIKRGGGLTTIDLIDKTDALENYYQIHACFETLDAMGANYINSCLEAMAKLWENELNAALANSTHKLEVVMSILSNYVPNCLVKAQVSCPVSALAEDQDKAKQYAQKFVQAVQIAQVEPYRAVTHNKGIMNGIDALVLATGNDFRAVEAGVHAYASRTGTYRSLSDARIENDEFIFEMSLPLALGTVGGLTKLHPLVKLALEMLGNPNAQELMRIAAVCGLAQNFAALNSLTTTGIQKGHMKMHLMNILNQFQATEEEKTTIAKMYENKTISHTQVVETLNAMRDAAN